VNRGKVTLAEMYLRRVGVVQFSFGRTYVVMVPMPLPRPLPAAKRRRRSKRRTLGATQTCRSRKRKLGRWSEEQSKILPDLSTQRPGACGEAALSLQE